MPTVMWIGDLRVVVYPNDHRPAHVHVMGGGCEAVFQISGPRPELRENYGFGQRRLRQITFELSQAHDQLIARWEAIHGPEE